MKFCIFLQCDQISNASTHHYCLANSQVLRPSSREGTQHILQTSRFGSALQEFFKCSKPICIMCLELKELVDMHGKRSDGNEEPLSSDEVLIIKVGCLMVCWHIILISLTSMRRELLKCVARS